MKTSEARKLWESDLARSGLTLAEVEKHGWKLRTPAEVAKAFPYAGRIWGYEIPYPQKHRGKAPKLYRLRILGGAEAAPGTFGALPDPDKKQTRYWQPEGTTPGVFFPPIVDWSSVFEGEGEIVIVEGEKKAWAGCKAGINVIGLGGVWSWKSKALGVSMLPELEAIDWAQRPVVIAYDSDARQNADVARAISALTEALVMRGARVVVATVPECEPGKKAGLDDYLLHHGTKAADRWRDYVETCEVGELARKLWKMSERYCLIQHPTCVIDEGTIDHYGRTTTKHLPVLSFKSVVANVQAAEVKISDSGEEKIVKAKVGDRWLEWPQRREFHAMTYAPGEPKILHGGTHFNTWKGLAVEPKRGDVKPWKQLLDHLFKDSPREHRDWLERWFAWPLVHLGAKMFSAVGFWGEPGRGKSILAEKIMSAIYGTNFQAITQAHLEDNYNEWAVQTQFVLIDDISSADTRTRSDIFKKLVTQSEMQVSIKYISRYPVPDHVNYYLTSNSPRAFHVEDGDRRFFIHRVPDEKLPESFYDHLVNDWLRYHDHGKPSPGGAALLWYFRNQLDFGNFNPASPPPMTQDKLDMIEVSRSPAEDWLRQFVDSEKFIARGKREVYSLSELCNLYRSETGSTTPPNAFGAYIRNAGMLRKTVREGDATGVRLVAVCNVSKWAKANGRAWLAEAKRTKAAPGDF